jgi:hypothetical protein
VKGELKALGKKLSEKLLSDVEMIVEILLPLHISFSCNTSHGVIARNTLPRCYPVTLKAPSNTVENVTLGCSSHCCKCILSSAPDPCVATGRRVAPNGRPCRQRHSCSMNMVLCILVVAGLVERRQEL